MAHVTEIDTFRAVWDREAQNTIRLLEALPTDQYDFRPAPKGRSIGELAWHLSEIDGCLSFGVAERRFKLEDNLPELVRPREVRLLLWGALLHHMIHHRAQLVLLCRMAGGVPPGLYGPNREEMEALRTQMQTAKA